MDSNFTVELTSRFEGWWRYNLALLCELRDADGRRTGFASAADDVAEVGAALTAKPRDVERFRTLSLTTGPCSSLRLFVYVIPHSLLPDRGVDGGRDFQATLTVRCDGQTVLSEELDINQWGGASVERIAAASHL
ncbi:MAG: hypothetical protein K2J51_04140 [Alistipes sp.]|nr:hypothetical protein [Alistipes sp.]